MPEYEKIIAIAIMTVVALGSTVGTFDAIYHMVPLILRILGVI